MSDKKELSALQPEEAISLAMDNLIDVLRAYPASGSMEKNLELISMVGAVKVLVGEYIGEKLNEEHFLMEGGELHKDHPRTTKYGKPVRKKGFIDDMHSIEYQISLKMNELLDGINGGPKRKPTAITKASEAFNELAKLMDDYGIYLDQSKEFAVGTTMPLDPNNKPDPKLKSRGIFKWLPEERNMYSHTDERNPYWR